VEKNKTKGGTLMTTLFTKIIQREIPAEVVYRDDQVTAFRDIRPQAPVHVLIVPNKEISSVNDVEEEEEALLGHMFVVAKKIARKEEVAEDGYRLIINCGKHGGQEIPHLHMHLFGGRPLGPMLVRD
jgi:histidine triad (HIT) family protein